MLPPTAATSDGWEAQEATPNRHKPMSPAYRMYSMPEVIAQVEEMLTLNEKHILKTITALSGDLPSAENQPDPALSTC